MSFPTRANGGDRQLSVHSAAERVHRPRTSQEHSDEVTASHPKHWYGSRSLREVRPRARLIFLFSLPRCGSTLLQRILAGHRDITSVAEPWLLLPPFYALRPRGVRAEYEHASLAQAMRDLLEELPEGEKSYRRAVRDFSLSMYSQIASPEAAYFLDKTPRYSLIVEEIVETFPDAKFIFLWRNPLAMMASMLTLSPSSWLVNEFHEDLVRGLPNLLHCATELDDQCVEVRYEDFIHDPGQQLRLVMEYLGLEYEVDLLRTFDKITFKGSLGDRQSSEQYRQIDEEPLERWKSFLRTPIRKWWCRRYLKLIAGIGLESRGYDIGSLRQELDDLPINAIEILRDLSRLPGSTRAAIPRLILRRAFRSPGSTTTP